MYPVSDNESWLGIKSEPVEEPPAIGNVCRSWQWRERGIDPPNYPPNKKVFENIAEDILVQKSLKIRSCDLPGGPRSTFLMVFSPDGTKVASTHGNHNVYVSELASGKHVRILKGHPRTPWCIAFHPSHPQLIGSGCLGGQVRVWDIASGGSEVWNVRNETVIASIAFHPREQLLVIATYNELYFWDWSHPAPFTKVSTNNVNEKVRFVAFDSLGYKLITGISLWVSPANANSNPLPTASSSSAPPSNAPAAPSGGNGGNGGSGGSGGSGDRPDEEPPSTSRPPESPAAAQDMIVNSYQTLVQRYDSLVRNYQRLFMVRHRLTNTPPPPNTIDRGTDPMETYPLDPGRRRRASRRLSRLISNTSTNDNTNPSPSPSTSRARADDGGDAEPGSRLLNLDVLSLDSDAPRNQDSPNRERSPFGSRSSAFQPLNESGWSFRTVDQSERTRLLPNPFSSRAGAASPRRRPFERAVSSNDLHSSRTCIFTSSRAEPAALGVVFRRRNLAQGSSRDPAPPAAPRDPAPAPAPPPATTNSSTQMSPDADNVDAQTINESLDLIRDILRDSGTRLLNLITNMSMNLMSGRAEPRERGSARRRPSFNLFTLDPRSDLLASSSDSDGDHTDILRTPNSAFREPAAGAPPDPAPAPAPAEGPTDRMVFELDDAALSSGRFRVRTQGSAVEDAFSAEETPVAGPSTVAPPSPAAGPAADAGPSEPRPRLASVFDPSVPSTSRDNFWSRGPELSSTEAFSRVKTGVGTLQKHTLELAHAWLRGERLSLKHLRVMWETLRRRILTLQRDAPRHDSPGYYTRSLMERCMLLTEMTDMTGLSSPSSRSSRSSSSRNEDDAGNSQENGTDADAHPPGEATSASAAADGSSASPAPAETRPTRPSILRASRSASARASPFLRRRLSAHRWSPMSDQRRTRAGQPRLRHTRRDFVRAFEISTTRHEIRVRAMQVLSVMFNMMMMCLGEPGLSQVIMHMLKALKKALALSCFMMMSNRPNPPRPAAAAAPPAPNVSDSMDVVRIQNAEHAGPVNVDGPDDPASPRVNPPGEERPAHPPPERNEVGETSDRVGPSTSQSAEPDTSTNHDRNDRNDRSPPSVSGGQGWSDRLAVQIAAANRNNSTTARTRRELYQESKRQKALHRTNPAAHPFVKRRCPPVAPHRIPVLRRLPSRRGPARSTPRCPTQGDDAAAPRPGPADPVAGPSNAPQDSRGEMAEFDNRVNLIRIAHMQAVRLRNAARNRFRRLQTIRLYTPSSVFALQANGGENQPEQRASPPSTEGGRLPFVGYGALGPRGEARAAEPGHFHAVLNNVAMPLMQVSDLPPAEAQPAQGQRLPRIHEYLQPIILAQNAMVVEDEGDAAGGGGGGPGGNVGGIGRRMGGMAGLLDAGIISEALPAPSNRVQAWDFTSGQTPDIADSTKNVVVQRCRIHNDASIDISKDGRLLVALLPGTRLRNGNSWLGVYSLEWARLGQCLHTAMLEQSAVSVALSPTARYLAVGLGSRRFTSAPHSRTNIIALLYKLDPLENSSRTGLAPIKELMQHWEHGFTSLNCLRWAPQPGQGLVYANNTGQLIIMS